MSKIAVIFYSLYGHTMALAETAVKAAQEDGAEVTLYQVPETLSENVLKAMSAAPRRTDIPVIEPTDLANFDGYIFVIPTRYGRSVAQFSHFFDHTGGIWAKQGLAGKFATVMSSVGTQNGGVETTAFTTLPFFVHHGIIFVPHGYGFEPTSSLSEIKGGAPWGAGTLAGPDGSRQPSPLELEEVTHHAKHFYSVVAQFKRGADKVKAPAVPVSEEKGAVATEKAGDTTAQQPIPAPEPVAAEPAKTDSKISTASSATGTSTAGGTGDQASGSVSSTAASGAGDNGGKPKKRKSIFGTIKQKLEKLK